MRNCLYFLPYFFFEIVTKTLDTQESGFGPIIKEHSFWVVYN